MPAYAKRTIDRFEEREKALGLLGRGKPLHLSFSHAGWLMRILGSIVKVAALSAATSRHY
jgi:hypothetical protein